MWVNTCVRHIERLIPNVAVFTRGVRTSNIAGIMAPIKVGDSLPDVDLYDGNPDTKVNVATAFAKNTHVIFGIPGAFTPTCQNEHFPTFLKDYDKLKEKGVETINCVAVNDPFVMAAFCKALGSENKVKCLADTKGEFTKAIDLPLDLTDFLGNVRSQRYAMVVKDGKVAALNVEDSPGEAKCSTSAGVLDLL